jgi:rhomboid family GlyGly-CTERM serine protease
MQRTAQFQPNIPVRGSFSSLKRWLQHHWDHVLLILMLIAANQTLLEGTVNKALIYHPLPVGAGEWWRLISYTFVHVSGYHLLLDAGGLLLLYNGLNQPRGTTRLMILAACSSGGLLFGVWLGAADRLGLAGLSGVDHGLMAFYALQQMGSSEHHPWGLVGLLLIIGKSMVELATGHVVFGSLHGGLCGVPVAASHAGGTLAGMLVFWVLATDRKYRSSRGQCRSPISRLRVAQK